MDGHGKFNDLSFLAGPARTQMAFGRANAFDDHTLKLWKNLQDFSVFALVFSGDHLDHVAGFDSTFRHSITALLAPER